MNDQAHQFFVAVDPSEPNISVDRRLTDLFPDNRLCVVMPRKKWPNYNHMDLSKAEITVRSSDKSILVTSFDLVGNVKEERAIAIIQDQPENMRFQIQYALSQLGALPLSNGRCSGSKRPNFNL